MSIENLRRCDISKMSVGEIRSLLTREGADKSLLSLLEEDPRVGVKALAKQVGRHLMKEQAEKKRLEGLLSFERRLWGEGRVHVAGVDEAGRGPLAGPVVSAAVILPQGLLLSGLDDSKKLTPQKREELFDLIYQGAVSVGIGMADEDEIDRAGILEATFKAMKKAIAALAVVPDHILVDGMEIPGENVLQTGIVKGDGRSLSIAAASVVAKVTRDRMMIEYDKLFPVYGFARHKGYGTREHIRALEKYGPCRIHRRSFRGVRPA